LFAFVTLLLMLLCMLGISCHLPPRRQRGAAKAPSPTRSRSERTSPTRCAGGSHLYCDDIRALHVPHRLVTRSAPRGQGGAVVFHERRGLKEQSCERFRMKYTTPAAQVMLRTFMAAWAMAVTLWRRVPCWVLRQCTAVVRWAVSTAGRMMPLRLLWFSRRPPSARWH